MLIECPRCDEADERSVGFNRCGLCECEFYVARTGYVEDLAHVREQARENQRINDALGGFDTYALGYRVKPNT